MSTFPKKRSPSTAAPRRRGSATQPRTAAKQKQSKTGSFRRGSTLAGSTSHTIKQASSTDDRAFSSATPREQAHHLARMRKKLMTVLSILFVGIILLLVFLYQFTAVVQVDFGDDLAVQDAEKYEHTIQKYLTDNPLERLRFNLNEANLDAFIKHELPEVAAVEQRGAGDGLVSSDFVLSMRKPIVSWRVGDTNYFVDKSGVAFSKNYYPDPMVAIVDNSGVAHTSGTAIASERFLSFVGQAVALAGDRNLKVEQVSIPTGTSRQVELKISGFESPVIMSIDRSVGDQVEDAQRALQHFQGRGRAPHYIDLRVKGKAFFRE